MSCHGIITALAITLWAATSSAQVPSWESANAAGIKVYQQRNYTEAENFLKDAFRRAEEFEGRYSEAEPLLQRTLASRENVLRPGPWRG
jgi:hypothetical protein